MKTPRTVILAAVCALLPSWGVARTALDFFTDPAAPIGFVSANTRLDMADYFREGMAYDSKNVFDEPVRIIRADSVSVTFRTASQCETTLSLLECAGDTILITAETVRLPQPDGKVEMWDTAWNPLAKPVISDYTLDDWLTDQGRAERSEVEAWLPFMLAVPQFDAASGRLVWTNTLGSYFAGSEESDRIARWLKPSLSYTFDGRRFRLDKN